MTSAKTNPFPGVPLVESPLFPMQQASLGLTPEENRIATDLHQHGFAVLDFPDSDLEARIERIKANLGPRYTEVAAGDQRIQDAWKFDDDVRAIAINQAMLDLLSELYGRRAFPFQTLNFPVGTQQGAHTDAVHFSSLPERFMCGVWLAMEDVSPNAGPLFYVPGSHRWPLLNNSLIGRRGHNSTLESAQNPFAQGWRALREMNGAAEEPFLAKKGQALIWTANLLHGGSHQSDTALTRWSQVTHYYFEDCIWYTPAFSDEALGRLELREPVAITDGRKRRNSWMGEPIKLPRPGLLTRMARRFRG